MEEAKKQTPQETVVQHRPNGQFAPGNTLGNRWKPGQSGNPRGRALEARLKDYVKQDGTLDQFVEQLARVALDPSHPAYIKAVQVVLDRVDGAVAKQLKLQGDLPLKVLVSGSRDGKTE